MAKPWRMRCQRSSGGLVRSMSATGGRGATVACAPSNGRAAVSAGFAGGTEAAATGETGATDAGVAGSAAVSEESGVVEGAAQAASSTAARTLRAADFGTPEWWHRRADAGPYRNSFFM